MKLELNPRDAPPHIDGILTLVTPAVSLADKLGPVALATPSPKLHAPLPLHHRDELELNLVVSGSAQYLMSEQRVTARSGAMIWLPSGRDRMLVEISSDFSLWVLMFRRRLVRRVCPKDAPLLVGSPRATTLLSRQLPRPDARALCRLYADIPKRRGRDVFNTGLAYALARSWHVYTRSSALPPLTEVHPAVERAVSILRQADAPATAAALARSAGLSEKRLSTLFKQQLGVPLVEFRNRERLERFQELYGDGARHTVTEAALLAGFGSYPQFYRVFKAAMGFGPAGYRERMHGRI